MNRKLSTYGIDGEITPPTPPPAATHASEILAYFGSFWPILATLSRIYALFGVLLWAYIKQLPNFGYGHMYIHNTDDSI